LHRNSETNHPRLQAYSMKYSSLRSCLLSAPTARQINEVTEHLRYWPYVKAYRRLSDTDVEVVLHIGSFSSRAQQCYFLARSRQLILLCLRQYGVKMGPWHSVPKFTLCYSADLYLRPDEKLKSLASFILGLDVADRLHHKK